MKARTDGLIDLLRELDAERKITLARAREIYGGKMSDATWKRVKKRLESRGCKLTWVAKNKTFYVADPLWGIERRRRDPQIRNRLTMLRAAAAALGSPYVEKLAPLFERWDAQLASAASDSSRAPVPAHRPQPRADESFYERLTIVEVALRDRRMISFTYTNTAGGKPKARQIEPYALHEHVGRFYVWGRERVKQRPKFFAIDLMRDVKLEDRFEPDPSVSLDDALLHSFGMYVGDGSKPQRIVVEVDAPRSAYVRARRWPAEISCEEMPDGRLRVTFAVTDPHEVVAWVLSFGGNARIVEPAAAADLARRAAEDIAERHGWSKRAPQGSEMIEIQWPKEL
jgi:predicted DNA-binding transcriptional regulator YafY